LGTSSRLENRRQQDGHVKRRVSLGHECSDGLKRNTPSGGTGCGLYKGERG
jgi:hypothetical protein